MQLNRAVALITGGAQGLGRAFANKLLKEGTKVVVADLNPEAGLKFLEESSEIFGENNVKFLQCDVSNPNQLKETFEEAKAAFGRLDIICNNAGIMTTDHARAKQQVDINLTAVIEGTYTGIDLMSTQKGGDGGVIVNVGSAAGIDLMMNAAVFSATKHAVVAFSRSFQRLPNFQMDGVRVNTICPFFVETAMMDSAVKETPENEKIMRERGMVTVDQVADGFMKVINDDKLNGAVVVIAKKVYEMKFGMVQK